eukprot:3349026-Lingulodinium_polyedra.AAC.1
MLQGAGVKEGEPDESTVRECLGEYARQKCTAAGKQLNVFTWRNFTMTKQEVVVAVDAAVKLWLAEDAA